LKEAVLKDITRLDDLYEGQSVGPEHWQERYTLGGKLEQI
jgi:hypothetical protein